MPTCDQLDHVDWIPPFRRDAIRSFRLPPILTSLDIFLLQLTEVAPPEPAKPREYPALSLSLLYLVETLRVVG